ncbi:RhsIA family immunity protein [Dickeya fangzhongdai]|uniref:RhsIA family immunity protein n=1 Tax=Dickeya fangzhongdai TaxID=1778540 RepID=UPI003307B173
MTELSKAEKVLKEFIIQMNQWELKYYPLFRNEGMTAYKDAAKKELDDIYDLFCTKKERKQGRQISLSCGEPPEYSPDEEVLSSELNKNKCVFITQQYTEAKNKFRYTLQFKEDEWLIDKKERFSFYDDKWIKYNL